MVQAAVTYRSTVGKEGRQAVGRCEHGCDGVYVCSRGRTMNMNGRIRKCVMRKEVKVGQGRLACVCPMSAIRSQMGLRDGMGGCRS